MSLIPQAHWLSSVVRLYELLHHDIVFKCVSVHRRKAVYYLCERSSNEPFAVMHEFSALHDDSNALAEVHVRSELSKVSPMTEKPLVSRAGDLLVSCGTYNYFLVPFVKGRQPSVLSKAESFDLGKALAKLHDLLATSCASISGTAVRGQSVLSAHLANYRSWRLTSPCDQEGLETLIEVCQFYRDELVILSNDQTMGPIHGDFHLDNLVFGGAGRLKNVLDFEFVHTSEHLFDLASIIDSIIDRSPDIASASETIQALVIGYGRLRWVEARAVVAQRFRRRSTLFYKKMEQTSRLTLTTELRSLIATAIDVRKQEPMLLASLA